MQPNDPMIAANQVARELNQPEGGKGAKRLADALSVDDAIGIVANYGTLKHPAETPMRMALLNLQARTGCKSCRAEADLRPDGSVRWWVNTHYAGLDSIGYFGDTLAEAIGKVIAGRDANRAKHAREATIRARIEKELAELDAAEAALKAKPEYRPDGSGADCLPLARLGPGGDFVREIKP